MKKKFNCENCGASGTIHIREQDFINSDIVFCPCCSSDISSPEDDETDEEE